METRTYTVYKYDELPKEAQEKVLENLYDINVDHEWWEYIYEDAKTIGFDINGFDLDRRDIGGGIIYDADEVVKHIKENHGKTSDTYAIALDIERMLKTYPEDTESIEEQLDTALREYYLDMLRNEYEHSTSEEAIIETIRANDYDFTLNGNID